MTDGQTQAVLAGIFVVLFGMFWAVELWDDAKGRAMNKLQESEKLVEDLKNALRAVGRALVDQSVPVPRRIDRAMGILSMYGCEAKDVKETPANA